MPLNLFIIGPSGCGKSTQAKLIADKYQLTHFSTGQVFRDEISAGSDLGNRAKVYIDQGIFVPDDILLEIVKLIFQKANNQNFILDGTPRRPEQAVKIQQYLQDNGQDVTFLIHLKVSYDEILKRRQKLGESFQDKERTDNTPKAVTKRQLEYDKYINPILDYFRDQNKLIEVDGNRPVEPIFADICQQIEKMR